MADTTLEIYRGDTVSWTCTFTLNGSAFDISGGTLWFTAKTNKDDLDSAAVIQESLVIGASPAGISGICNFILTPTGTPPATTSVPVGSYFYDFQFVSSGGNVTTLGEGKLKVLQDITISTT